MSREASGASVIVIHWAVVQGGAADNPADLHRLLQEDAADMSPALKQKVRMAKVFALLTQKDALALGLHETPVAGLGFIGLQVADRCLVPGKGQSFFKCQVSNSAGTV